MLTNGVITKNNLERFAFTNGTECATPLKGIVLEFHGLNHTALLAEPNALAKLCTQKNVLYLFPYYGPWAWMNDTAVSIVDGIIDAAMERYHLPEHTPILSTGGSMGGQGALIYTRYTKHTPTACAANCPVCDLPFHYTERDDLPRTIFSAFAHYPGSLEDAIMSASPLHQAKQMPDIPYYVVHGDADLAVNKEKHSDKFVAEMKKTHRIEYDEVPGMEHCALPDDAESRYYNFIFSFMK